MMTVNFLHIPPHIQEDSLLLLVFSMNSPSDSGLAISENDNRSFWRSRIGVNMICHGWAGVNFGRPSNIGPIFFLEKPQVNRDEQGCSVAAHPVRYRFCHKHYPIGNSDSANRAMLLPQVQIPGAAGLGLLEALPCMTRSSGQTTGVGALYIQRDHHGAYHPSRGAEGAV